MIKKLISFGMAAVTGALRMASGNHFFTDVITGAVIGTACVFLVPFLHSQVFYGKCENESGEGNGARAQISPAGFNMTFSF